MRSELTQVGRGLLSQLMVRTTELQWKPGAFVSTDDKRPRANAHPYAI